MNSTALQQKYPEVYQKFFVQCPLVLSAPLTFYWTEHPSSYSGVMIRQKIPLKVFLGVEFIEKEHIELGSLQYFSNSNAAFFHHDLNDFLPNRLEFLNFIKEKFKKDVVWANSRGVRFHTLVEDSLYGYPNGTRANISALMATIFQLLSEKLSIDQIQIWKKFSPKSLLKDGKHGFTKAFELARIFDLILLQGHSWTTTCFSAMVSTPYPIIAFPAKTIRTFDYEYHQKNKFNLIQGNIPFWGYDLRDLYPDLPIDITEWLIDFGVIYSGKSVLKQYSRLRDTIIDYKIEDIRRFIHEKFSSDMQSAPVMPDFYDKFGADSSNTEFYTTDLFGTISIRLIDKLYHLLLHGYDEKIVNEFINLMHSRYASVVATDPMSEHMRKLLHRLNSAFFHANPLSNFSIFAMYDGARGGNIGFVSSIGTHRKALENAVQTLQKEYPDLAIEYLSWRDGYCSDGVIVEQYMDQSITSKHLGKNLVKIIQYRNDGKYEKIVPFNDVDPSDEKSDVTLNLIENNITMGNLPVSSKELHSQTATIQIVTMLLDDPSHEIMNTELKRSAYATSKNEMQGKITGPFCRLMKERTGKTLEIKLKGTNTNFNIALKLSHDSSITIIQKLFDT